MAFAVILASLLLCISAHAANAPVEDPETKVEISIYDLVKPHKRGVSEIKSGLDSGYVEAVIKVLKDNRDVLLTCLKSGEEFGDRFKISITASGEGKATSTSGSDAIAECAVAKLDHLAYPKHRLKGLVEIEFPLVLEKRSL